MDKLSLLKSVFVFSGLDEQLLSRLTGQLKETKFAEGREIFSEGRTADSFFIVDSGEVIISKQLGPDQKKTLAVLGTGSVFGEMAFFSDSPRTANAVARTACTLWRVERNGFMKFIADEPQAGLRILSGLLQVSMDRLEQTSRELATIYQTGKIIASGKRLEEIAQGIQYELLLAIPEADHAAAFLYNEFNDDYDPVVAPQGTKEIPLNHPMIQALLRNTSGIMLEDCTLAQFPLESFLSGAKALLLSPITKGGRLIGFLALWNTDKKNVFKNSHCLLLASVSGQLAEAIENLRHQQEERDRQRLKNARHGY